MPTTNRVELLRLALRMAELRKMFGGRIRELRMAKKAQDRRWTQDYAARQVSPDLVGTQWSRWERGVNLPVNEDRMEAIARVLDTSVADLYKGPMADRPKEPAKTPGEGPMDSWPSNQPAEDDDLEKTLDVLLDGLGLLLTKVDETDDVRRFSQELGKLLERRQGQTDK